MLSPLGGKRTLFHLEVVHHCRAEGPACQPFHRFLGSGRVRSVADSEQGEVRSEGSWLFRDSNGGEGVGDTSFQFRELHRSGADSYPDDARTPQVREGPSARKLEPKRRCLRRNRRESGDDFGDLSVTPFSEEAEGHMRRCLGKVDALDGEWRGIDSHEDTHRNLSEEPVIRLKLSR